MSDPVQEFFEKVRARSTNPPRLRGRAPKMDASVTDAERTPRPYRPGRPSGNDGRARRRPLDVPALGTQLRREISQRGWEHELAHGWVMGNWANLVGEQVAKHCQPVRIEEKVVYISCDNSTWATQLRYLQKQILRKISDRLGPDVIVELRIQGPKQRRNYEGRQWIKPQGSRDTYG